MTKLTVNIASVLLLAATAVACSKNDCAESAGHDITFTVRMADETKTAGQYTASSLESLTNFKVSGYDGTSKIIDNRVVTKSEGEWKLDDNPKAWIDGHTMTFWADANMPSWASANPSSSTTHTLSVSSVPESVDNQWDPLIGHYNGTGTNGNAVITFYHPFTAVAFVKGASEDPGITAITGIKMSGVYGSGSVEISSWNSGPSYSWTPSGSISVTGSCTDNHSTKPFILIPQNLASKNVLVEITATRSGSTVQMYATINSGEWLAGKTNVYTLDYKDFQMTANLTVTLDNWGTVNNTSEGTDWFNAQFD